MLEAIVVFSGVAIALYVLLELIDRAAKLFRQFVLKDTTSTQTESQKQDTNFWDRLANASQTLPANFDLGSTQCHASVDACPKASEVVSGLAEGVQGALEGVGEHLGKVVEAIGHAAGHTGL